MHDISPQSSFNPHLSSAEERTRKSISKTAPILGVIAITAILFGLVSYGLILIKNNQINALDDSIEAKNIEIQSNFNVVMNKAELAKEQIEKLKTFKSFDFKKYLFEELSATASSEVRLTSLTLDHEGFSIEGQAQSYSDIAKQIALWKSSKIFSGVELTSATSGEELKQFTAKFSISSLNNNR